MEAMMRAEFACTGLPEMSWFHGLSGGKTWRAARIRSAPGVPNSTGLVIGGIGGGLRGASAPLTAAMPTRTFRSRIRWSYIRLRIELPGEEAGGLSTKGIHNQGQCRKRHLELGISSWLCPR